MRCRAIQKPTGGQEERVTTVIGPPNVQNMTPTSLLHTLRPSGVVHTELFLAWRWRTIKTSASHQASQTTLAITDFACGKKNIRPGYNSGLIPAGPKFEFEPAKKNSAHCGLHSLYFVWWIRSLLFMRCVCGDVADVNVLVLRHPRLKSLRHKLATI